MIYRRSPLSQIGCFTYAAAFEGQNYVQYGLGHETENTLQRCHVMHENVHHLHAIETAELIECEGIRLTTGRLHPMFKGLTELHINRLQRSELGGIIREVFHEAFGNPRDGRVTRVPLQDNVFAYIRFAARGTREELLVGGAAVSQGIAQQGEPALRMSSEQVFQWVVRVFADNNEHVIFKLPPVADFHVFMARDAKLREIATEVLRVATLVWPESANLD